MAGAKRSSRWTDARLDDMRELGDEAADTAIDAVFEEGDVDAVNAIFHRLVSNNQSVPEGLPKAIQDYLAATVALPGWADMAKIKRGQQLFETWGLQIAICLFCASLPSAYAAADGVKVLYLTAQLDTDTRRRVMETGQFLINVLAVGSFEEHGKGLRTIQHVRLMHAAVRKLIEARSLQRPGLWDPGWGRPINQEDLAGTLLSFSYVVVDPLRRLGVRVPKKDVEAYLHLWDVIGHLLGVHKDMLVHSKREATDLVETIRRRQFRASPEGQEMTAALMKLLDEMTPFHRFDDTVPPLIRHLIGDEIADMLLVPESALTDDLGRLAGVGNWFFLRLFGRTVRNSARYQRVSDLIRPFGRDVLHGLFRLQRGGERARFDIPDHLARSWELSG
jgi:ER-bound oxygenase mpaB/B'/Rubber oxygenase, catalytic domain